MKIKLYKIDPGPMGYRVTARGEAYSLYPQKLDKRGAWYESGPFRLIEDPLGKLRLADQRGCVVPVFDRYGKPTATYEGAACAFAKAKRPKRSTQPKVAKVPWPTVEGG